MSNFTYFTLGQAAKRLGVQTWCIQRCFEVGLLPEPQRIGILRVVTEADLPAIRDALIQRGYLDKPGEVMTA